MRRESSRRVAGLLVALLVCWAVPSFADDATLDALHAEERTERRTFGLWRARISHPLRVSGGVGLISARVPAGYDCRTVCRMTGFIAEIEPGLAGVQLAAGYGTVLGEHGARHRFVRRSYIGYGVRAAVLRTSAESSLSPARQTLVGVEGQFTVIDVSVSIGAFRHVSGGAPDDEWIVTGGLGFGF